MSKQKTYWGVWASDKRHLWTMYLPRIHRTACGLIGKSEPTSKGDKCKNCIRAIKN